MSTVGQIERATQNRIVRLFRERLGWSEIAGFGLLALGILGVGTIGRRGRTLPKCACDTPRLSRPECAARPHAIS